MRSHVGAIRWICSANPRKTTRIRDAEFSRSFVSNTEVHHETRQWNRKTFQSLPIIGAQLTKLRFFGNGKDSEVTIKTAGNRPLVLPLEGAKIDLALSGPISIAFDGWDDVSTTWEIAPTRGQSIRIDDAAVDFPGSPSEWQETLDSYERTGEFCWAVPLRLRLTSTGGAAP